MVGERARFRKSPCGPNRLSAIVVKALKQSLLARSSARSDTHDLRWRLSEYEAKRLAGSLDKCLGECPKS